MKNLNSRQCLACQCIFTPLPQHPNQQYCSNLKCQRVRKNRTTKHKMQTDAAYRENQSNANRKWRISNPDYQRNYRKSKKVMQENIALSNQTTAQNTPFISGNYRLTILEANENMDAIIVRLEVLSNS